MEQLRVAGTHPYDLWFGHGVLGKLSLLSELRPDCRSACLVCDKTVAALYAGQAEQVLRGLGYAVSRFSFSVTEDPRGISVYERLIGHLQETAFDRTGMLIALGDTEVQHLTGFTAATASENVSWVSVPTTLSGMIAPRTSERYSLRINGRENAAGVTHAPVLTLCDMNLLATLPDSGIRSGYAQVIRYSLMGFNAVTASIPKIRDVRLPEAGSSAELPSDETVAACIRASVSFRSDEGEPKEPGTEIVFADAFATAIEECSGFSVSRGYAVSAAMGILAQMSVQTGSCDRKRYRYLATRLMQTGLPTGPSFTAEELRDHIAEIEKKYTRILFLRDVGCAPVETEGIGKRFAEAMETCRIVHAVPVGQSEVYLPYSKELVIRTAFAWFLDGFSLLDVSEMPGDDIKTMDVCLRALLTAEEEPLRCGESATVLRLLLPLIGVLDIENVKFLLGEGLFLRPHEGFLKLLREHGMTVTVNKAEREFVVGGKLVPGEYVITDRNAAEQVCGLLFILPLLHGDSTITIPEGLLRKNIIHMTINVLHMAGVNVFVTPEGYSVPGEQRYDRFGLRGLTPERDWSIAAVFKTLSYITGEEIPIVDLPEVSLQGDRVITDLLRNLREASSEGESELQIDLSDVPNLIPCVAVAASLTEGVTTTITGLEVLSDREGNRIQSIATVLSVLGADISITTLPGEEQAGEVYVIRGRSALDGGVVDAMGDHRIAMMAAVAAWGSEQPVTVTGADAVDRSFPAFFDTIN